MQTSPGEAPVLNTRTWLELCPVTRKLWFGGWGEGVEAKVILERICADVCYFCLPSIHFPYVGFHTPNFL